VRDCRHLIPLLILALSLAACGQATSESTAPAPTAAQWSSPTALSTSSPTREPTESIPTEEVVEVSVPEATVISEPTAVPEPTETPEEAATEEPTAEPSPQPDETSSPASSVDATTPLTHVVQAGENLFRISLQYGRDWHELAAANNLTNPNVIRVGESLTIPSTDQDKPLPLPTTHVVQGGENLYRIGIHYDCPWEAIARANGIVNPNRIYAGQTLTIPSAESPSSPVLPTSHTVQHGENLFRIGLHYGVPWPAIAQANGITDPDRISVGTILTIPVVEK
jgi:LysM repeat protein